MRFTVSMGLLFVHLLLGGGCARESLQPIVHIQCDVSGDLADKIDLAVFGPFRPGIQLTQARVRFGEPKRVWQGNNGTVYHLYPSSGADVAVAKEIQISGGTPRLEWWTIYAFPSGTNAFSLARLLSSDVLNEANKHEPPYQLIIQDPDSDEGIWCKVTADGIIEIRWVNAQSKLHP